MAAPRFLLTSWLILLLAISVSSRTGFSPNTEYKYEYVAQIRTGLPDVGKDKNVVGLRSIITVQTDGNDLLLQLKNVEAYNGKVIGVGETQGEIPLEYLPQSNTEFTTPFKVLFQGTTDELRGIEVNPNDPSWAVDIKKAIAVIFNVRLDQQLARRQGSFASQPHASYEPINVVESGLEGKCMSKYLYQQLPWAGSRFQQVLNVTKIRDVTTCEDPTYWQQTIHEPLKCSDCAAGQSEFMNWAMTSKYGVYEDNGKHFIERAEFFSLGDTTPSPPKGNKVRLSQYQRLLLVSSGRSTGSIRFQGQGIQHQNMGVIPIDANTSARFKRNIKTGYGAKGTTVNQRLGYKEDSPLIKVQKKWTRLFPLIEDTPNISDNYALNMLSYTVDNMRLLSVDELAQIYKQYQDQEQRKNLVVDLIVMTGTDASIIFVKGLLERKEISGERAAQIISSIPAYVMEPQPAVLEEIWALCKDRLMRENRQVYVTTLLTFGELVNQACVPKGIPKSIKPYHINVPGCPAALTTRYLQELMNLFDRSNEYWEKSAILYSIYRMGLNDTLDVFIPYFQKKIFNLPSDLRAEMLMGLFEVGPGRQKDVFKYVMPIFYNASLTALERIMAFEVIAYTTTSQLVMNQLALSTWHEKNHQVATYVYSYLYHIGTTKTKCWGAMSARSEEAIKLAKPVKYGLMDSFISTKSVVDEKYSLGSMLYWGAIQSDESVVPQSLYAFLGQEVGGYYVSMLEIFTLNKGLQKVVDNLVGPKADYLKNSLTDIFKYRKDQREGYQNTVTKDGKIKVNFREDEPVSTRIMFSYLQNRHRLFFIDENTLNDIRNSGILPPKKDLVTNLRDGIPINFQKALLFEDYHVKFPSVVGLPITIAFKMPAYVSIRGKISMDVTKTGSPAALSSISVKPEFESTLAINGWTSISVDVPYSNVLVAASATKKLFFSVPTFGSINLDLTQRTIEASLRKPDSAVRSHSPSLVFRSQMIPMLYTWDKTTDNNVQQIIRVPENTQAYAANYAKLGLGIPLSVKISKDVPVEERKSFLKAFRKTDLLKQLTFWWAPKTFHYQSFELIKTPQESETDQIELKLTWSTTQSSLKKELWLGKSPLQQLRLWNLFPEWEDFPLICNTVEQYRGLTPAVPPKKSSFFGRVKDKFKAAFGRSGGSDDDDDTEKQGDDPDVQQKDDNSNEKDDHNDDSKEDRGRALHPHIASRPSSGSNRAVTGSSSQYGSSSTYGSSGSTYGSSGSTYGSSGSTYGSSGSGYGTSGSTYGSSGSRSSQGGYSQTQYGSGPVEGHSQIGQTQSGSDNVDWEQKPGGWEQTGSEWEQKAGGNDNDDWEQKPGGGGQVYPPGNYGQNPDDRGTGVYGQNPGYGQSGGGVGQNPGGFDQRGGGLSNPGGTTYVENKAKVYQLPMTEDKSQTNIYVQINTVGSIKREIAADISFNSNSRDGSKQSSITVTANNVIPGRNNFKICYTKNYYDGLRGQCSSKGHTNPSFNAKVAWGDKCESGSYVSLTGTYDTEPEQFMIDVRRRQNTIEPGEYLLIMNNYANVLTKAKYDVTFAQPFQFMINASSAFDNYLKCYLSDYLTEDTIGVQNEQGKISAEFHYDLIKPLLDVRVKKPKETIVFEDIQYSTMLPFLFPRIKNESFAKQLGNVLTNGKVVSECRIGFDGHSRTFNGLSYDYTASECPYVIAKDCSTSDLFQVTGLMGSNRKVTIDLLEHRIEIKIVPGNTKRVQFLVDGAQAVVEDGKMTFIRSEGVENRFLAYVILVESDIIVKSPPLGLNVKISQAGVFVQVSKFYKGKVCGICGEFNDREDKTFYGPNKCLYGDAQTFVKSYQVPNSLCPMTAQGQGQCLSSISQINKDQYPIDRGNVPSPDELYRGPCYLQAHKMFRRFGKKVCFTIEPVRQCSPTCVKQDTEIVQIPYKCYYDSSQQATDLTAAISQQRPLTELRGAQPDGSQDETVPKVCVPARNY